MCFSCKIMHAQPYSAPHRKYVGYMHAVSIRKGCWETVIDLVQGIFQKGSTWLWARALCSKDFQCRIVAFMLNIRQWYYILRRDSKFLLASVLLSPSVNEEVFSQQFTHHNLKIYIGLVSKNYWCDLYTILKEAFFGALSHGQAWFPCFKCCHTWPTLGKHIASAVTTTS